MTATFLKKLMLVTMFGLSAILISCEAEETNPEDSIGGANAPTLSGDYKTSCFQITGSAMAGETHFNTVARFSYNGAGSFNFYKYFYSDASCTTRVYGSSMTGTFAVGAATTTPADAYLITYSIQNSYVTTTTGTATTNVQASCNSNVSWGGQVGIVSGEFNCANLSVTAGPFTSYNIFKVSGNTMVVGVPRGDDPGVATMNALDTSTAITFTKY